MQRTIGELNETWSQLNVEWKLTDFFSLPDVEDTFYSSPFFYFAGEVWCLRVYPNGESKFESIGEIDVCIQRVSSGPPISLIFSIGIRAAEGLWRKCFGPEITSGIVVCDKEHWLLRFKGGIMDRETLKNKKWQFCTFNAVTIICTLVRRERDPTSLGGSLSTRLMNLSSHLRTLLTGRKQTDVVLQVEEDKLPAHRMILESRSPAFFAMFNHDVAANQRGEIIIKDVSPGVMKSILSYVYCGQIDDMSYANVFDIYAAANRFNFSDLKLHCRAFIEKNLCVERIGDVIQFADLHHERETEHIAKVYLRDNMEEVLKTDQWQTISNQNPEFWMKVLISAAEVDSEGVDRKDLSCDLKESREIRTRKLLQIVHKMYGFLKNLTGS